MKKITVSVVLLILIAVGYGIYQSPLFRIQKIDFNSSYDMDLDAVAVHTGLKPGIFYFSADSEAIRAGLLNHPFVKNVTVSKVFPNQVILDIEYREHFLTLRYLDILISLDDEMVVLGLLSKPKDGFVVEGISFETYTAGRVIEASKLYVLQNIVNYIKLFDLVKMTPEKNVVFRDNCILFSVDGIVVNFGLGEHYEKRFNDFVVVYGELKKEGISSGMIDVSSDGSPGYQPFFD